MSKERGKRREDRGERREEREYRRGKRTGRREKREERRETHRTPLHFYSNQLGGLPQAACRIPNTRQN